MKPSISLTLLTTLTLFLTACPQAVTPPPAPPATPEPETFPVTEISGTLVNWTAGEAYLTLAAGYSASSTPEGEEVTLIPPLYPVRLSATGAFAAPLGVPAAAELVTLTCGSESYQLGFLAGAVASSAPEPTPSDELSDFYTLGPSDSLATNAAWVYSAAAHTVDAACALPGDVMTLAVTLDLVPGWNQALLTQGQPVRLESGPVPASFVWSKF